MGDGKHCPVCGVDIGVWPIVAAGLPNMIRCPRCKVRLGYRGIGGVVAVLSVLTVAVAAAALIVAGRFTDNRGLIAAAAVGLGAWVPVELATAHFLRRRKILECRSGDARPARKTED